MTCQLHAPVRPGRSRATSTRAFLERCRETVAQFGVPERLQTSPRRRRAHAADRRRRGRPDVQLHHAAALPARRRAGAGRARRCASRGPAGTIALNFRTWTGTRRVAVAGRQGDARAVAHAGAGPRARAASLRRPASAGRPTGCRRPRCVPQPCAGSIADRGHRPLAAAAPFGDRRHDRSDLRGRQPQPLVARRQRRAQSRDDYAVAGRRTADAPLALAAMKIGVVGATGQVGAVMRPILAERNFPVDEIRYFASARSAGTTLPWKGTDDHRRGRGAPPIRTGLDIALFSAGATSSRELAPRSPPPASSSSTTRRRGGWIPTCR